MRWFTLALGLGLFLGLGNVADAAPKTKKHHIVRGQVVEVLRDDKDKTAGVIKVRVSHHGARKAVVGVARPKRHGHVVTLKVHNKTHYEKMVVLKGGQAQHVAAAFRDVHKGEHVHVHLTGKTHPAHKVQIVMHARGAVNPSLGKATPLKPVKPIKPRKPNKRLG